MTEDQTPWYRRAYRWGQTNLTEVDPLRYDAAWWRAQWKRTRVQGVIVNAGGIVAYYPSTLPQHRAQFLGDRDLFGEIVRSAREDGLTVLARMDANRVHEPFYIEHPDWVAIDEVGRPYKDGELYFTCVNTPYYAEFIPSVIREIALRYHPDGLTDNSWSYGCRLKVWDLFDGTARQAGGESCLYLGMNSGDLIGQSQRLRDYKPILERSRILMLDFQSRQAARSFAANTEAGALIHEVMGWDKLVPESTALYGAGQPTFRLGSKPEPEARMWAVAGFAGGISPWWHHISAYHEDRRQYRVAEPIFAWHEKNEKYLADRQPLATVGVVWSQRNIDFYGQDSPQERVGHAADGVTQALVRARIPYLPVHVDHIERAIGPFSALILPSIAVLSDEQCRSIREYVEAGGSIVATGETSLFDEWGERRPDFGLANLFGARSKGSHHGFLGAADPSWANWSRHTYLRLHPERRALVDGPLTGDEPDPSGERHPVLEGFDETDVIGFGGRLEVVESDGSSEALLGFVPPFPIYPPELSWMRQPTSNLPAALVKELPGGGRVVYFAADLDRCFGRDNLPDHGKMIANAVRWAAKGRIPIEVEGAGTLVCQLYQQKGTETQAERLVLHLVNITATDLWRGQIHELIPVGPLRVTVRLPEGVVGKSAKLLVAETEGPVDLSSEGSDGSVSFTLPRVVDHEVVVIE